MVAISSISIISSPPPPPDPISIPFGEDCSETGTDETKQQKPRFENGSIHPKPSEDETITKRSSSFSSNDDVDDAEKKNTVESTKCNSKKPSPFSSWRNQMKQWTDKNISENLRFTLRVTVALTLASLFVFCQNPDPTKRHIPSTKWVYITAGVTSFQPSPDLGAVYKKAWQRFLGTIVGGLCGLGIGAIALLIPMDYDDKGYPSFTWVAIYLGVCQVFLTYTIVYFSCRWGFRSHYSAILSTVTAGMALLAFYNTNAHKAWKIGTFRIVNIAVGGILGSIASIIVFPVSTKKFIESKINGLTQDTGTAVKEVLASIGKEDSLPSIRTLVQDKSAEDSAHAAYIKCIEGRHKIKAHIPFLDYDPTFKTISQDEKRKQLELWNMKLSRLFRIQMNLLWLDNIVRSKLIGDDVLNSDLLESVGEHIASLFDGAKSDEELRITAITILNTDLPAIRKEVLWSDDQRRKRPSFTVLSDPTVSTDELISALANFDDEGNDNFVKLFFENQTDTLYRMVEILILRCLRLHHTNG